MGRICVDCKHLTYIQAEEDWSDLTPGSNADLYCTQGVWRWDPYETTEEEYRQYMKSAETCNKFEDRDA